MAGEKFEKDVKVGKHYLTALEELKATNDPITSKNILKIKNPVQTPSGQIYEKKDIKKWVERNGTDPYSRKSLSANELRLPDVTRVLIGSVKELKIQNMELKQQNKIANDTIKTLKDTISDLSDKIQDLEEENRILKAELKKKRIGALSDIKKKIDEHPEWNEKYSGVRTASAFFNQHQSLNDLKSKEVKALAKNIYNTFNEKLHKSRIQPRADEAHDFYVESIAKIGKVE
jgi:hypothetical protein